MTEQHDAFAPSLAAIADEAVSKFTGVKFVASTDGYMHCEPATDSDYQGIAQTDCAQGREVTVKLVNWGYAALADSTGNSIAVGDPLVFNASGVLVKQTAGLAYNAVALKALSTSAVGVIEVMPITGPAQVASSSLAMIVDTGAGIAAGQGVYVSAAGHCDLIGSGAEGEDILIGIAQTAGAHNAVINVVLLGPLASVLTSGNVAVGDTLALDGSTSEFKTQDAGPGVAVALTANTSGAAALVLAVLLVSTGA